jgi:hypothetical protein
MARRRQAANDGRGLYLPSSDCLDAVAHMDVLGVLVTEAVVRPSAVPRTCEIDRPAPKILEMSQVCVGLAVGFVSLPPTEG